MHKQILPNRWFIWTIVFLVSVSIVLWGFIEYANIEMDIQSTGDAVVFTLTIHKIHLDAVKKKLDSLEEAGPETEQ
jgi:hypothetical protein